jgi:membrane-bound lytic murein transglycosylase MltF
MRAPHTFLSLLLVTGLALLSACADRDESTGPDTAEATTGMESIPVSGHATTLDQRQPGASPGKLLLTPSELGLPAEFAPIQKSWTGDFDKMIERRVIRVLTVFQAGGYYLDGPEEKGLTFELVKMFEKFLNERLGTGHVKVHAVLIPVAFDQLLPALVQGYGDIAVAGLTITPERQETVDFSEPLYENVSEIVIAGSTAPQINTINDLSGKTVYIKPGSSYRGSLEALSSRFQDEGRAVIEIIDAPPHLQDVDLLEMVSAGMLPMVVMDDFKARLWADVMDDLILRDDLVVSSNRSIGWAMRKNSPLLKAKVDEFAQDHRKGTLLGNVLINRYLKDTRWVENALDPTEWGRFNETVDLFRKYSTQYEFDYLMVAALGYQESRLDQNVRSNAGAIGIMQLLKSTATDPNVSISDIEEVEHNIHAGVKYLNFLRSRYFTKPEIDVTNRALFSFAAYNAGPARIRGLMQKAEAAGLDPNRWFNNVELIAAREIGRETVDYVSNIYKYYFAYSTFIAQERRRAAENP